MNLEKWIEEKFNTTNYTLEKTDKGISNHNYVLTINDNKYMVRVPKKNHESLGLQHEHEKVILPLVSDLDVPTVLFDEKKGIKVTHYIEDVKTFDELLAMGIKIDVRKVPTDSPENFDEILKKAKSESK